MKKLTTSGIFIGSILLTACASQGGWTPTVDSYNDPNAYRINQDMAECKQLASQASGGTAHGETVLNFLTSVSQYNFSRILRHS
jgi:hypothetical protein